MEVMRIQNALAELRKQADGAVTETAPPPGELDGVISKLSSAIGDAEEQEGLKKEAYLRRRSNLLVAKVLAGIDALASQGSLDG